MKCLNCDNHIPSKMVIKGKERNFQRRKYCLECSPFGAHNTKQHHITKAERFCSSCGKKQPENQIKGTDCWTCRNKKQRIDKKKALYELMGGEQCQICGYSRCAKALDFHHVDPEEKSFGLTLCEMSYAWERLVVEAKKCVLICSNCHREVHDDLVPLEEICRIHKEIWDRSSIRLEQRTHNPLVGGSSPPGPTKEMRCIQHLC